MADIKFSCPHCNQRITCDALWGGHELQCPSCQNTITVPASTPAAPVVTARATGGPSRVPPPPPGNAPRLSIGQNSAAAPSETPSGAQRVIPIRNLAPTPQKKKSPLVKYASAVVILIGLGAGGYYGYPWLKGMRDRAKAKQEAADQNSGGTQATATGPKQRPSGVGQEIPVAADANTNAAGGGAAQALIPAVWTLDLGTAKIPESKVNGMIAGTNFVLETARVDPVGAAQVLRLTQGQIVSPDREILIYLHLKPGEKLGGQSLSISSDMMGSGVPQVAKRWKSNPRFAAQLKSFYNGYALKLQLGQVADNAIPGKVFLALPDTEQTVVAGVFKATVPVIDPNAQPQPVVASPMAPGSGDASRAAAEDAMRRRYGTARQ